MSSPPVPVLLGEDLDSRPKRTCIRSIFPLELMEEIFTYCDKQTFVNLCRVSYSCCQEAVRELYRDVVLDSDVALLHFFTSPSLPRDSRLRDVLSTSHIRTLALIVTHATPGSGPEQEQTIFHYLGQNGTSWLPPRLAASTTVRLDSLTISAPFFNGLSSAYWTSFLPHFNPVHVRFWSDATEELSRAAKPLFTGIRRTLFLLQWTRLREVSFVGWLPLDPLVPTKASTNFHSMAINNPTTTAILLPPQAPRSPIKPPSRFFLHDSPHLCEGPGDLVLHVDGRLLDCRSTMVWQAGVWTEEGVAKETSMFELKGLGVGGLKVEVDDSNGEERAIVDVWMKWKLTEEQRDKVEVVKRNLREGVTAEEREMVEEEE
ncbi:hypothetical protein BDY24DRAFT_400749 [Mrakia frigida]|uniref:uncharacterized protein n=1 Tax=Mrakia frigida TaxID=29902 RepID=UPI003FCC03E4